MYVCLFICNALVRSKKYESKICSGQKDTNQKFVWFHFL